MSALLTASALCLRLILLGFASETAFQSPCCLRYYLSDVIYSRERLPEGGAAFHVSCVCNDTGCIYPDASTSHLLRTGELFDGWKDASRPATDTIMMGQPAAVYACGCVLICTLYISFWSLTTTTSMMMGPISSTCFAGLASSPGEAAPRSQPPTLLARLAGWLAAAAGGGGARLCETVFDGQTDGATRPIWGHNEEVDRRLGGRLISSRLAGWSAGGY
uniref:Uncharacterized protein n=1 Tax=Panagrellus redivivus TaxID=6233 RepID=A0A7E4VIR8_PANRE